MTDIKVAYAILQASRPANRSARTQNQRHGGLRRKIDDLHSLSVRRDQASAKST